MPNGARWATAPGSTSDRAGWPDGVTTLFDELEASIPWRAERRQMYDRVLDVPRLVSFHDLGSEPAPHPAIAKLRVRLNDIYAGELGEPFTSAGLCLYRDGADSVAWHGDTIGRSSTEDTMVAIVTSARQGFSRCGHAAVGGRCGYRRATATCW